MMAAWRPCLACACLLLGSQASSAKETRLGPPGPASRLSRARDYSKKVMSLQAVRVDVVHRRPRNKAPTSQLRAMGEHSSLDLKKLAWLHVPKTGTSFVNTLLTWACDMQDSAGVDSSYENATVNTYVKGFLEEHRNLCPEDFDICGGHHALGDGECNNWEQHKGHFVGMFRNPAQRVVSGFFARQNGSAANYSLLEYAKATEGCSTKMLNGIECAEYSHGAVQEGLVPLNESLVSSAVRRIDEGFSFVGLQEEWGLSVCLFHKMFGGQCHAREFLNTRPTEGSSDRESAEEDLKHWADPYDGAVYDHVQARFWEIVDAHQLSLDVCAKEVCKDASDEFLAAAATSKLKSE